MLAATERGFARAAGHFIKPVHNVIESAVLFAKGNPKPYGIIEFLSWVPFRCLFWAMDGIYNEKPCHSHLHEC
jgi:hypothetical protein